MLGLITPSVESNVSTDGPGASGGGSRGDEQPVGFYIRFNGLERKVTSPVLV